MTGAPRGLPRSGPARGLAVVLVLVVIGTVGFFAWPRNAPVPPVTAASATPPRVPIAVSAGHRDSTPVIAGVPTTFTAHALGEVPLTSLELWAGDELVATEASDSSSPAMHARWDWAPDEPGQHVVFVRAIDALGRMRQSNVIRVDALPGAGETAGAGIVLAGAPVQAALALELPAVQADLDGCSVVLDVSALAAISGFTVYELPPSGFAFLPLASMAAGEGTATYEVPTGAGSTSFVIGAFDATVEVLTAPITVVAPEDCGADEWAGGLALQDGMLVGGPPVDRAYLYLRSGDDAAQRIPLEPGTFVEAVDGALDFGDHLPALTGPVSLEAWGWHDGALTEMGSATWTPQGGGGGGSSMDLAPGALGGAGTVTTLNVVKNVTVAGPDPCGKEFCTVDQLVTQDNVIWPTQNGNPSPQRTLRWSTLVPSVDHVIWQVLPYAPASSPDLTPPFLVDQGVVNVTPGTTSGEILLDLSDYFGSPTPTYDYGLQAPQTQQLAPIFGTPTTPLPPATPSPAPGSGAGGFTDAGIGQLIPSSIGNQVYVRIIPMQGSTPGFPSNPVHLDAVPPPDQIELDVPPGFAVNKNAYTVDFTFTPPKDGDGHFARCAVVTGHTDDYAPPPSIWPYDYDVGDVLCYSPPDDDDFLDFIEDGFAAFVDLVENVWDGIQEGYVWIQDQIVKAILIAVPCTQIASDAVCETIAKTALSVALASLGIPPTIPDFGAVMDGLKGDLRTLVLEAAKTQFPAVEEACGLAALGAEATSKLASCEALVDEAIDEVVAQVEAEVSAAAGGATGKSYPGVIFAPDPRGVYQPPTITLTIERTDDPVLPNECTATASMISTKTNHTWQELIAGWPKTDTGTVSGQPFLPETFTIPPMEPGESTTRTVWLSDPATWFESQDAWEYAHYYNAIAYPNHAYQLLTEGSSLMFKLTSNCFADAQQGPHVLVESAID